MILRILTGICGIAVIYFGLLVKNDTTGKYSTSLRAKYTNDSVDRYLNNAFYSELLFGGGLIIESIFGSGLFYWIGLIISFMGIISIYIFIKGLENRKLPYRKDNKK